MVKIRARTQVDSSPDQLSGRFIVAGLVMQDAEPMQGLGVVFVIRQDVLVHTRRRFMLTGPVQLHRALQQAPDLPPGRVHEALVVRSHCGRQTVNMPRRTVPRWRPSFAAPLDILGDS